MSVLLVTADTRLADLVAASAATVGLRLGVSRDVESALGAWAGAAKVLVGADLAAALVAAAPRPRPDVFLVFDEAEGESGVSAWSVPLGAQVIGLPGGSPLLAGILAARAVGAAPVLGVLGGSGGIGTSTLVVGLGAAAARERIPVVLVDVDPRGGGLDLLLGAERESGWRWEQLAGARGHVGDLSGRIPRVDGVDLVSVGRGVSVDFEAACEAVVGSLRRTYGLVVLDLGRGEAPPARVGSAIASRTLLLTGSRVRAVAAARETLRACKPSAPRAVVRRQYGGGVSAALAAETLGLELAGSLPEDPSLVTAGELGEPPGRGTKSAWSQACSALLTGVMP